jgi:hypothetical protein
VHAILLSLLLTLALCFDCAAEGTKAQGMEQRISELEPFIGGFPPNLEKDEDLRFVEAKYDRIKQDLDVLIKKSPKDLELLFLRGHLQVMGHNFDKKGAWNGAETDLLKVLRADPKHERALVEIGLLYVNTNPGIAPKAQEFFNRAQAVHGSEPLEPAQQGLFFCLYYQGRIKEASKQADLLRKQFPNSPKYQQLYEVTQEVVERIEK